MATNAAQRRLAAILVADVVGYSRLMGLDEAQTLRQIKAVRKDVVDPALRACRGRVVKTTGDGLLVEFPSAVEAVRCSAQVQREMATRDEGAPADRRIVFRIGIHSGDIVGEGEDIFGDGVNVAARLETLCEPGGVCISGRVQEDLAGRLELPFEDRGEQQVKNIARPVRTYGLSPSAVAALDLAPLDDPGPRSDAAPAPVRSKRRLWLGAAAVVLAIAGAAGWTVHTRLRDGDALMISASPRVAVLPFDNLSGDPGLNAFADGLSEELITDLAEYGFYDVVARNTTFQYKGQAVDVPAIGRKLGADYVVEGSVRGSGDTLDVTAQLIDASTGAHVWAQTLPGSAALASRGQFQNDAAHRISVAVGDMGAGAIAAKAFERSRDKSPEALSSFECIAAEARRLNTYAVPASRTRACLEATVKRDPNNAEAWAALTQVLIAQYWYGVDLPVAEAQDLEKRKYLAPLLVQSARRAIDLAPNKVSAHFAMFLAYWASCQRDRMRVEADRLMALNPNAVNEQAYVANGLAYVGDWDYGRPIAEKAIAVTGPAAPKWWRWATGKDYYHKGDYENAYKSFLLSYSEGSWLDLLHFIYTLPYLGRTEEAKARIPDLMKLKPEISIEVVNQYHKMWCFEDDYIGRMDKALRMAGLRETADSVSDASTAKH